MNRTKETQFEGESATKIGRRTRREMRANTLPRNDLQICEWRHAERLYVPRPNIYHLGGGFLSQRCAASIDREWVFTEVLVLLRYNEFNIVSVSSATHPLPLPGQLGRCQCWFREETLSGTGVERVVRI